MLGICQNCKSEGSFSYGSLEPDGESIYYPLECEVCGWRGREYYNLEYSETVPETEN